MRARRAMAVYIGVQVCIAGIGLVLKFQTGECFRYAWQMFSCAG